MDIKTDIEFKRSTRATEVYTESSCEYALPDYCGDVRKIIFTSAKICPSGKFASGDEIDFSGLVSYDVVYLDSEDNLSSVSFSSDYEYSLKCRSEKYRDAIADTDVSSYTVRPRRIVAKSSVVGSVRICENEQIAVSGDALNSEYGPEVDKCRALVRESVICAPISREYGDTVRKLDGVIADEVNIIYTNAEIIADPIEFSDGYVICKGKIRTIAVIKEEDGMAYPAEKLIPFEENIQFEDADEEMHLIPDFGVTNVKASVNPEETGSCVMINATVSLSVIGEKNNPIELVSDAYLKSCSSDNTYEDFNYFELRAVMSESFSETAQIPRAQLESNTLREIVFLDATLKTDTVERDGECVKISGEVRYCGIASEVGEDGQISYIPVKFSSPFTHELTCQHSASDTLRYETKLVAHSCSASIDSGKIYAECKIDALCVAYKDSECRILVSSYAKEDNKYENKSAQITVYYPSSDETLFEVAKKFHTSRERIALVNSIEVPTSLSEGTSANTLVGVKKLLIYN